MGLRHSGAPTRCVDDACTGSNADASHHHRTWRPHPVAPAPHGDRVGDCTSCEPRRSRASGRRIGTGFTGRRAMGQKPLRWADIPTNVETVQALLRGETVLVDGQNGGDAARCRTSSSQAHRGSVGARSERSLLSFPLSSFPLVQPPPLVRPIRFVRVETVTTFAHQVQRDLSAGASEQRPIWGWASSPADHEATLPT